MASEQEIICLYKPRGLTMGGLVEAFKLCFPEYKNSSITYAGRLDPLAEGLVILLSGEMVHRKDEFLNMDKEYEFEFVLGFKTDTYDVLGLVVNNGRTESEVARDELLKVVREVKEIKEQSYPPFSSKTVNGKPLFKWVRELRLSEIEIPKRSIEIKKFEILDEAKISGEDLLERITSSILLVKGDFRQDDIQKRWNDILSQKNEEKYFLIRMKAFVSSGTYIRGLVNEIGERLGVGAVTLSIKRTRVGDYSSGVLM